MTSFIADLKTRLPQADWPVVVAALRSEAQVWAELQDAAFGQQALQAAGADRSRWSPAFLGLLRLGVAEHFESLRAAPMQPVSEKLRYQAAAAYEELASQDASATRSNPDLQQATLLALAMRERRRLLNGWEQLASDLIIAPTEFWKLPLACLLSLIPKQHELLQVLLAPDQPAKLHQLAIHALVSNPLTLDVQATHLLEIIPSYDLPQLMGLLRTLAQVRPPLAQQAAMQALEDLDNEDAENQSGVNEIQRLLLQAEIYQISEQPENATPLLHSAWEAAQVLQTELAAKVAEANGDEAGALAALQVSADLADPGQPRSANPATKRPAALLSAARIAFKAGDVTEAKSMALAALRASTNENASEQVRVKASLLRELGELFVQLGSPTEAEQAVQAAMDLQSNDADTVYLLSKLSQTNGRAEAALQHAHLAAALAPQRVELRRHLAQALQKNQDSREAFIEWKAVVDNEAQPDLVDYVSLAATALASGDIDESIKACQQALALQPSNGAAHALMGKALAAQGDEPSAIEYLQRATELAPAQLEAWLTLIEILRIQGKRAEALAGIQVAQQHTKPSAKLQALFANLLDESGQAEEALATYRTASQLAAEQGESELSQKLAHQFGALQRQLGLSDAALQTLEVAQSAFPDNSSIACDLGLLLLERGEPKRALASLKIALQAEPDNAALLMALARALLAVGEQPADAEQALWVVLAGKAAPPEAKAMLPEAMAAQGKNSEAVKHFDIALRADLAKDPAWRKRLALGKARSLAAAGKPVAAINTLEALDNMQPNDLEILRALCAAYQQAGRVDEASQLAQQVYSGDGSSEETLLWYAELMQAIGKSAEACQTLRGQTKLAELTPRMALSLGMLQWHGESKESALASFGKLLAGNDAAALAGAAAFLLKQRAEESAVYYRRAIDISPPSAELLDGLTQAYIHASKFDQALDVIEKSIQLAPHNPKGLELKADLLQRLGKPQAALKALNGALELLPNDANLMTRKAALLRANEDWSAAFTAAARATELDLGHLETLQSVAELAVLNLQSSQARDYFANGQASGSASFEVTSLQAELALEAGEEIAAAKLLASLGEGYAEHPRVLALQSQLAACRGDRSQAAELLQLGLADCAAKHNTDIFTQLGLAIAAEKIADWDAAIQLYEELASAHPGLASAQFKLGRAYTLRGEWQQLCEASGASLNIPGQAALSKPARSAAAKAFDAAGSAALDSSALAQISGWKQRAQLRFGATLDLETLPNGFPSNTGEAAALFYAGRDAEINLVAARIKAFYETPEVLVERALATTGEAGYELIVSAAKLLSKSAPVLALAAHLAFKAGQIEQALNFIQQALALLPGQPAWQHLAGALQQKHGRLSEAAQHFQLAAQLEPEQARHYFALGEAQSAAKLAEAAVESLQKAVDLQPKQAEFLLALAKAHRLAGDDKQAKSLAQQAYKAAPQSVPALLLQAELALAEKDTVRAKDLVEQALRQDPKDSTALALFGETLFALGQTEDALAVLDRAAKASADEVPVLIRRAQFLPEGRGLDALVKLSQKHSERAEVFFALSQMLALTGNLAEAIQAAQHAVKKAGILSAELGANIHLHLGQLLKHNGNLDQSLHQLDEAVRLAPQLLEAYLERGRVFLARRQQRQALAAFQQAAAVAPQSAAPYFEAGMALKEGKDYNAAENELRKAARLSPKDRNIQRQLAAVIALNLVHHRQTAGVQL